MTLIKLVANCTTGEITESLLTEEEIAQREIKAQEYEQSVAEEALLEQQKIAAKDSAKEKLALLGLSEDEVKAILSI